MNRRAFLAALGAVATQQKFGAVKTTQRSVEGPIVDGPDETPSFTTTRFPYLQNVRSDRASILWVTLEAGVGQVGYSSDGVNFRFVTATSRFFNRTDTKLLTNYVQY